MDQTGRSISIESASSTGRKKKSGSKLGSTKGLLRKMTVKLNDSLIKTQASFTAEAETIKKKLNKQSTEYAASFIKGYDKKSLSIKSKKSIKGASIGKETLKTIDQDLNIP